MTTKLLKKIYDREVDRFLNERVSILNDLETAVLKEDEGEAINSLIHAIERGVALSKSFEEAGDFLESLVKAGDITKSQALLVGMSRIKDILDLGQFFENIDFTEVLKELKEEKNPTSRGIDDTLKELENIRREILNINSKNESDSVKLDESGLNGGLSSLDTDAE